MASRQKEKLPQEGSVCPAVGESLSEPSRSGCPAYSGGGIDRRTKIVQENKGEIEKKKEKEKDKEKEKEKEKDKEKDKEKVKDKGCAENATIEPFLRPVVRLTRAQVVRSDTPANQSVGAERDLESEESDCSGVSMRSTSTASGARNRASSIGRGIVRPKTTTSAPFEDEDLHSTPTNTRSKKTLPKVDDLGLEMRVQPTDDLGSCIMKSLETIENVADKSRNLKGDMVRALRVAVRTVQAAASEVIQRVSTQTLEQQNAFLRSQIDMLHNKLETLSIELEQLRSQPTVTQQTPLSARLRSPDETLMDKIGTMIEGKLASFKAEFFPDKAIRPNLGKKATVPSTIQPNVEPKKKKKKVKNKKGAMIAKIGSVPPVAELPSVPVPSAKPAQSETRPPFETWEDVVSRKAKAKQANAKAITSQKPTTSGSKVGSQKKFRPSREPKSAAISVTILEGKEVTYAQVMQEAKQRIKLAELGITEMRQKKAINGGLLLEISGADRATKADALAARMRESLAQMGVKIARPQKMGEARIMDLDESITSQEIACAITESCGCAVDEVKIGKIRRTPSSLGTVWVQCPLVAIRKLATMKRIRVGWVSAKVEVLAPRPLQCFRCLEQGHARHQCTSTIDRSALCYVCGEPDHKASQCTAQTPNCVVCASHSLPADHRLGSRRCSPPTAKRGKGKKRDPQAIRAPSTSGSARHSAENHRPTEEEAVGSE